MARTKTKETEPMTEAAAPAPFAAFDGLMQTAAVDSQIAALADDGADQHTLETAMTAALREAQGRWGLGLHHLRHEVKLVAGDIELRTDGTLTALASAPSGEIARAYGSMQALDERGLSLWGVLPEGHRVSADAPFSHLKILIEEGRDFETHWMAGRGGSFYRTWRMGHTLTTEVARPMLASAALSDAAWDVITSIKDRSFQRELMRRSEEVGMLGALLAARHSSAGANLALLPEAHFTVQAVTYTLEGDEARNAESYRNAVKTAQAQLEEHQSGVTGMLSEVLRHGLQKKN